MQLKQFDETDWMAFSGAAGADPMICYEQLVTVDGVTYNSAIVVDDNGLEVYLMDETYSTQAVWQCHPTGPKPKQSAMVMAAKTNWYQLTTQGLNESGFVRVA